MCVLVWVCFIEPERYVVGQWWPNRVLCHPFLYFLKLALGRGSFSGSSFLSDSASALGWATSSSHKSSVISSNGPPLGKKLWPLTAFCLLWLCFPWAFWSVHRWFFIPVKVSSLFLSPLSLGVGGGPALTVLCDLSCFHNYTPSSERGSMVGSKCCVPQCLLCIIL